VQNDESTPEGKVEGLVIWVVYAWVWGGRSGIVSRGRVVDAAGLAQALSACIRGNRGLNGVQPEVI